MRARLWGRVGPASRTWQGARALQSHEEKRVSCSGSPCRPEQALNSGRPSLACQGHSASATQYRRHGRHGQRNAMTKHVPAHLFLMTP